MFTETSHCHPNPCENGGTCHEDENAANNEDWWCECAKGYNGRHCHGMRMYGYHGNIAKRFF